MCMLIVNFRTVKSLENKDISDAINKGKMPLQTRKMHTPSKTQSLVIQNSM